MPNNYSNIKGRRSGHTFLALPHALLNQPKYIALSIYARALLVDIAAQYNGRNNGDLCASAGLMKKRGWSKSTLERKVAELLSTGLLEKTRQGGRNKCNLYAITWQPIDECNGKLDVKPTNKASNLWRT